MVVMSALTVRRLDHFEAGILPSKATLHWSPDPTGMPFCGAPLGAPWTYELEHVSCPECQERGWPRVIQYHVSTR